jgi:hypothetical protein
VANEQNFIGHSFADKPENINRKGYPKGKKNRSTIIKELLAMPDESGAWQNQEYKMMKALLNRAQSGDVSAVKEIQDTMYGKIPDKVLNAETTQEDLERDVTDEILKHVPTEILETHK